MFVESRSFPRHKNSECDTDAVLLSNKEMNSLATQQICQKHKLEPQSLHECFCEDTYSMLDMLLRMAVSITTFGNIDLSHLKVTIRHKFLVIRRTRVTQTARLIG